MTHWQDTFDDKELQWKQIFTCPYTLTIDTKLRASQYKYILKILLDNSILVLYHPVFMTRDSLSHMFWECHITQAFWRNVTVFLQNKLSINIELVIRKILFVMTHIQMLMEKINQFPLTLFYLLQNISKVVLTF